MAHDKPDRSPQRKPHALGLGIAQSSLSPTAPPFQIGGSSSAASVQPPAETPAGEMAERPPKSPNLQPPPTANIGAEVTSPPSTPRSPRSTRAVPPRASRNQFNPSAITNVADGDQDKGEVHAESRLAKQKNEHEEAQADYYDKALKSQEDAKLWQEKFDDEQKTSRRLAVEVKNYTAEVTSLKENLELVKGEGDRAKKDLETEKGKVKEQDVKIKGLEQGLADTISDLRDEEVKKKELQEQVDDLEAQRVGLHEEIDDLKQERDGALGASAEDAEAREALVELNEKFEQMFKELGEGLSMTEYLEHIRNLQETSRPRRDDSQTSLFGFGAAKEPNFGQPGSQADRSNRQVSNASVADELKGMESGGDSEVEDDVEDPDPTITTGGNFSKWQIEHGDEPQSVRNPAVPGSVEQVGEDSLFEEWAHKRTQTPGDARAIAATTTQTGTQTTGATSTSPPAQREPLSFSGVISGASTAPIPPQSQPLVPAQVRPDDAEIMRLKTSLENWKQTAETRDKDRVKLGKSLTDTLEKLNVATKEIETLKRSNVATPAPVQPPTASQNLGLSRLQNIANIPPVAPLAPPPPQTNAAEVSKLKEEIQNLKQKLITADKEIQVLRQTRMATPAPAPAPVQSPAANQNLGFSGMQNIANIPPVKPPAANQHLGFSGTQNIANIPPVAPVAPVGPPPQTATTEVQKLKQEIQDLNDELDNANNELDFMHEHKYGVPRRPTLGFSGIQNVANIPPVAPARPVRATATTQTRPWAQPRPRIVEVMVYKVPQSLSELLFALPWWLKLVLGLLIALLAVTIVRVLQEKNLWLSANDIRHEETVRLTGASSRSVLLWAFEEWMGLDRQSALLG